MSWMSVVQNIPTSRRKEMKTSIDIISSDMNPPNYSLSYISARFMYMKLIQPLFKAHLHRKPLKSSQTTILYNVCAVPWGVLSTVGVFSTVGDIMSTVGGYLEYRGGCSVPWGIS